jgi:hypothetical protein
MKRVVFFFVLGLATSGIASADVIVALNSGPVVNGGNFNWTYTATLKSGASLLTGDFFTIYDIGGFGPGAPIAGNVILPGSNWSSSIQLLGTNGFATAPADSNSIFNVTYTFTGSSIIAAADTILGGGAGAFGYTSSSNTSFTGAFSATSHITAGGATAGNNSTVTVAGAAPAQVPESSTTLLSGIGLIALGLLSRRRRRAV